MLALGHGAGGDRRAGPARAAGRRPRRRRAARRPLQLPLHGSTPARARQARRPRGHRRRRGPARPRGLPGASALVLGGKSMGGRIASQAVAQGLARGRPRLPRLSAASARPLRHLARPSPARDHRADALRPGDAGRLRARGPAGGGARRPRRIARRSIRSRAAITRSRCPAATGRTPAQVEAEVASAISDWLAARGPVSRNLRVIIPPPSRQRGR